MIADRRIKSAVYLKWRCGVIRRQKTYFNFITEIVCAIYLELEKRFFATMFEQIKLADLVEFR